MSTELQKIHCLETKVRGLEKKLEDTDELVRTMSASLNATQMALLYISDRLKGTVCGGEDEETEVESTTGIRDVYPADIAARTELSNEAGTEKESGMNRIDSTGFMLRGIGNSVIDVTTLTDQQRSALIKQLQKNGVSVSAGKEKGRWAIKNTK